MLVHPCLELTRVRRVSLGEAVSADREAYRTLGFADPRTLTGAYPLVPVGQAWIQASGSGPVLSVVAGDSAWSAPASQHAADLVASHGAP